MLSVTKKLRAMSVEERIHPVPIGARVLSIKDLDPKDAKYLNLGLIEYQDVNGQTRTWECMQRKTLPKGSTASAVLAIVMRNNKNGNTGPEILLEKQFRPPAGRVVIEVPAGLIDDGETPEQTALREVREETGYVGEVVPDMGGRRPLMFSSPGASSESFYTVNVKVDCSLPENQDPEQELEGGEFIEPFWVPLKDLYHELRRLEREGNYIDGKLGHYAEGVVSAQVWADL